MHRLGATMNMVQLTETVIKQPEDNQSVASEDSVVQPISRHVFQNLDEMDKSSYDRVRMILQNYLLIRILLNRVILSPWHCTICAKPVSARVPTVLLNQRILASVFYEIVRTIDSSLPPIEDLHPTKPAITATNTNVDNDNEINTNSLLKPKMVEKVDEYLSASMDKVAPFEYKQLDDISEKQDTLDIYYSKVRNFNISIYNFGVFVYNSSLQSVGSSHKNLLKLDEALLNARDEYESLEEILGYLIPCDKPSAQGVDLYRIREKYILPWCKEYSGILADWIDRLAIHVIHAKLKLKEVPIADDSHALDT